MTSLPCPVLSPTLGSSAWAARARELFPGGVNSPVRSFQAVGGIPRFLRSARGALLTDVDGWELIDYVGSWGAAIAGHAHPVVVEAITEAAAESSSFGLCCPREVALGETLRARFPSLERLRFTCSGTEAVMSALRLARAATGRPRVIKFAGNYHGHADPLLVRAGSGAGELTAATSAGLPPGAAAGTLVATYNDLAAVAALFARFPGEVAAVIVEPVAANMGVVPPRPGFLAGLADLTRAAGALLLFDEVITGCRLGPGGAQELYGVRPDLTTLGKTIGGGLPIGAYGGRAELMDWIAPAGPVYQAGTLAGNPLSVAAGSAALSLLDAAAYARLEALGARLERGLVALFARRGERAAVQRVGSLLTVFFGVDGVSDESDARRADSGRFARFFHGLLERGVHLPPAGFEAWFLSLAHDEELVDRTLEAAEDTLQELGR